MNHSGLYVHVPFCDGKCAYCAFYSVKYSPELADRYLVAVDRELALLLRQHSPVHPETIYFGGGTPTVLSESRLERLCGTVTAAVPSNGLKEWTVEANPGTLNRAKLDLLRQAGVNRLSLGVQSFSDPVLKTLGRRHSAADAVKAVEIIRQSGFTNLGIDLIACVPGVGAKMWRSALDQAIKLKPEHISVYALTVEEGTALCGKIADSSTRLRTDAQQLAALHLAENTLCDAGYTRYEISNYALPGHECLHSLSCWRGLEYLGLGPAASSHAGNRRWTNRPDVAGYLESLERDEIPPRDEEVLSPATKASELAVFGLRAAEGIDPARVRAGSGISAAAEKKLVALLRRLSESGLVERKYTRWVLTGRGRDLADYVAVEIIGWEEEPLVKDA